MKFELEKLPRNSSFKEIKNEMLRVARLIKNHEITTIEFDQKSKISSSALKKRYGNWKNILDKCGLGDRYSGKTVSDKMKQQTKHLTDEEIIKELQRVARSLPKNSLTKNDLKTASDIISASTIRNRFGSWTKGLKAAELNIMMKQRRYSQLDYFENMLKVWTHYGRQPKYREMDLPPSIITSGAYEAKWVKWSNALLAFIDYINKDRISSDIEVSGTEKSNNYLPKKNKKIGSVASSRNIPIGLRYNILRRDKFSCAICGRVPKIHNITLEVDHIIPFNGNNTVAENLRTLCNECNGGKSDKIEN
jgi:hypothetical protein